MPFSRINEKGRDREREREEEKKKLECNKIKCNMADLGSKEGLFIKASFPVDIHLGAPIYLSAGDGSISIYSYMNIVIETCVKPHFRKPSRTFNDGGKFQ